MSQCQTGFRRRRGLRHRRATTGGWRTRAAEHTSSQWTRYSPKKNAAFALLWHSPVLAQACGLGGEHVRVKHFAAHEHGDRWCRRRRGRQRGRQRCRTGRGGRGDLAALEPARHERLVHGVERPGHFGALVRNVQRVLDPALDGRERGAVRPAELFHGRVEGGRDGGAAGLAGEGDAARKCVAVARHVAAAGRALVEDAVERRRLLPARRLVG